MGYDPFSPISLAQVNVLCLPVGQVSAQKFEEYLRALRAFSVVSLRSVTSTPSSFNYKDGHILLNISKEASQNDSDPFEFNARPQIALGLVDGEALTSFSNNELDSWLESAITTLWRQAAAFPETAICCIVVLGGNQIPGSDNIYYVDLDGDGPSLLDAIQDVICQFQARYEGVLGGMNQFLQSPKQISDAPAANPSDRALENDRSQLDRRNSPSVGSGSDTATPINQRNEGLVKHAVLTGQIYLQAGQWPQALRHLSEGATAARNDGSYIWQAKALEGLFVCMMLFAWSHLDFNIPQICYPSNDRKAPTYMSPSMAAIYSSNRAGAESLSVGRSISSAHTLTMLTPYLIHVILALYERASEATEDGNLLKSQYQARIRWGNLFVVMKKHGSIFSDVTLRNLIEGNANTLEGKSNNSSAGALVLHVKALTKLFVDTANEAQLKLSVLNAAQLQVAIAFSLSLLGVERKQAFHLREFLQKLAPALSQARRVGAAEAGVHPSASMPAVESLDEPSSNGTVSSGIQALLDSICESYGLPKMQHNLPASKSSPQDRLREYLNLWSMTHQAGDLMMKIDTLRLCVEVSDAIPDLPCSLNFISRLFQVSVGKPTLSTNLSSYPPSISNTDQSRFLLSIRKTAASADKFNIANARSNYWDKCLVRFITVSEEPGSSRLMLRTPYDLSLASSTKNEARKDPFIFNPFAKTKDGVGQSVIVVGEQVRFNVVLQNPLQVDVEIDDIMLKTEGCDFQPDHHSIVLGPLCSQTFILSGRAQKEGSLLVIGCTVTVRGCYTEDFLIVEGEWKPTRASKQQTRITASELLGEITLPEIRQTSLKVIAPLPRLFVASTSLLQQSIMLLEGEQQRFTLTLQNSSDLDVDFLLFTFQDSVTHRLEEALNNKDLSPADLYEIQNQIATRPIARLVDNGDSGGNTRVPALKSAEFLLELYGRPGLTDVIVLVDYVFLGRPKEEIQESVYTRQLRYTIDTTVNGSIDIPRCSVLPLDSDLISIYEDKTDLKGNSTLFSRTEPEGEVGNQCMLLLDVRNIWPQPLDVEFQVSQPSTNLKGMNNKSEGGFSTSETLQPGQMTRILVLVPQILVTDPYNTIPSLDTKRQFVVSASKMTIEAEAASRESFWYREGLLRCLNATWKEQRGSRMGDIDMRKGIRLSSRMIDALKVDLVEVTFSLEDDQSTANGQNGPSSVVRISNSHYSVRRSSFVNLVTKIHNYSNEELRLLARLQPSLRDQPHNIALDLSKRFTWTGVLQRAVHPPLKPNETRKINLGIIAFAEGEYEINATVEEIISRTARTETTALELGSGAERRIWHARRPCLIDARSESA